MTEDTEPDVRVEPDYWEQRFQVVRTLIDAADYGHAIGVGFEFKSGQRLCQWLRPAQARELRDLLTKTLRATGND